MRLLYVAKHDSGDNDDEGAIAFALEKLGHTVVKLHEKPRHRDPKRSLLELTKECDFCLFHKWENFAEINLITHRLPCVFWYFDMIQPIDGDPTLMRRSESRVQWMRLVIPHCLAGFCTDGDWVKSWTLENGLKSQLHWLMQGADERKAGYGQPSVTFTDRFLSDQKHPDILFTGMINHGQKRAQHVEDLREKYGSKFMVLGDGGPNNRKHGRDLADLFASVKIVVAPDGPSTDRYWSNRVYLTTSLGGFLLHPYCEWLARQYEPGVDLLMYKSRRDLNNLIDQYLQDSEGRERFRAMGYQHTMAHHTYFHRCASLIETVEKLL